MILAALAVLSGFLNAPGAPIKTHYFQEWVEPVGVVVPDTHVAELDTAGGAHDESGTDAESESHGLLAAPRADEGEGEAGHAAEEEHGATGCGFDVVDGVCYQPALSHAEFKWSKAVPSIALVAAGVLVSAWLCVGVYGDRRNPFKGLTERNALARGGHRFLVNKYYLDALYENVIVRAVAYPISKAAYWVNQHVIDGAVNGAGRSARGIGTWVYRNIDQRVVDGAVNASGTVASEGGHALQPVQSGKVNQYGALLFGAAAVAAIVLIITNV